MKKEDKKAYTHTDDFAFSLPTSEQLKAELNRINNRSDTKNSVIIAIAILIITSAAVFLLNSMLLPVMKIYGTSMEPTLKSGSITVSLKTDKIERGDICFFNDGDTILCKRIIGTNGDTVRIDEEGNVYVNGEKLDEPYISKKALGNCDIEFPYVVSENEYFVMGDNRPVSEDSRNSSVGCISKDKVVSKLIFCIWPFSLFGAVG